MPGASASVSFTTANQGSSTANSSTTKIFLSASNSVIGPKALLLRTISCPSIIAGQTLDQKIKVKIPAEYAVGDYYLWVKLDPNNTAGQGVEAKANDKNFVSLVIATDATSVPSRYDNALAITIKALGTPTTLPDLADTIKGLKDTWTTVGEDFSLLKTAAALRSSFEAIKASDPSLKSEMEVLEQRLDNYVATKYAIQGGALVAKLGLDLSVDYLVGDKLQHKEWLPVLHSLANTFLYEIPLAALYFSVGDDVDAGQLVWSQTWDQAILVWKESAGLDSDMSSYVDRLRSGGFTDIQLYKDAVGFANGVRAHYI